SNDLDKIKKLTLEIINNNNTASCPVCDTKFKNQEILLNNVQNNLLGLSDIETLKKKLIEEKALYKKIESKLNELYNNLIEEASIEIITTKNDLSKKKETLQNLMEYTNQWQKLSDKMKKNNIHVEELLTIEKNYPDY